MRKILLAAALAAALAGCGASTGTGSGTATVWVTSDRGAHVLHVATVPAGSSVMQALERVARVRTRFGGRYVQEVDGLAEHGQRSWFYYVNGYLADRSAADYRLGRADLAWWDYRAWRDPAQDPVVVGAFPEPFLHGYGGERHRTVIVTADPERVRGVARRLHASVARTGVGTLARDVNVVSVDAEGPTAARLTFAGDHSPGAPVKLTFSGDASILLRRRPFRFRYQVDAG